MPHALLHPSLERIQVLLQGLTVCTRADGAVYEAIISSLICEVMTDGRSFMWSKNKRGPSTVPCGTPDNTLPSGDLNPSTTTPIY